VRYRIPSCELKVTNFHKHRAQYDFHLTTTQRLRIRFHHRPLVLLFILVSPSAGGGVDEPASGAVAVDLDFLLLDDLPLRRIVASSGGFEVEMGFSTVKFFRSSGLGVLFQCSLRLGYKLSDKFGGP